MDVLFSVPVILKVLLSLGLILAVNAWSRSLLLALLLGTLALGFWCGFSPETLGGIAWRRAVSLNNLMLMVIIFQVVWLSSLMSEAGVMNDLVTAVRSRISSRASIAVLPALIGWLPMPGGALFSAPLVAQCDRDEELAPLLKTRINYWFRHIWEYWWPLYPGVLLVLDITGLDVWQLALLQLPLSVVAAGAGYWFLLRQVPGEGVERTDGRTGARRGRIVRLMAPVLTVVLVYALVRAGAPAAADFNRYLPMALGLVGALLVLQWQRPASGAVWRRVVLSRKTVQLALLVAMVRIYGAVIEADLPNGVALVEQMRLELDLWGIPVVAMIVLIPFVSGITSGLAIGFVGASFPIVMSLIGEDPSRGRLLSTTVLAFSSGYMGMMLSPVHICLIVTNEHFRTRLVHSLAGLIRPAAAVLVGGVVLSVLVRLVLA